MKKETQTCVCNLPVHIDHFVLTNVGPSTSARVHSHYHSMLELKGKGCGSMSKFDSDSTSFSSKWSHKFLWLQDNRAELLEISVTLQCKYGNNSDRVIKWEEAKVERREGPVALDRTVVHTTCGNNSSSCAVTSVLATRGSNPSGALVVVSRQTWGQLHNILQLLLLVNYVYYYYYYVDRLDQCNILQYITITSK